MNKLNKQQQDIVNWVETGEGSLNIVARAGCGKTFVVVEGVVKYLYENEPGQSVAAMAYNKKAGDEINARLAKLGLTDWKRIKAGTVHAFGFSAWRKVCPNVKVEEEKVPKIILGWAKKEGDGRCVYRDCLPTIRKLVSLAKQSGSGLLWEIGDVSSWYEIASHHGIDDDLDEEYSIDEIIPAGIRVLRQSISMDRVEIDFDDMILAPLLHKARFWKYDWVLLDEAQDTNPIRRALALALLKPKTGRLIAVGDDRQAIYGFTGADSDAMEIIRKQLNSKTLPLNVTFRCPKVVVELAQQFVPDFTAHESAPQGKRRSIVHSPRTDIDGNAKRWFEKENPKFGDAILCRNMKPLIEEAYALLRAGIGCIVEGRDIGKGLVRLATRWKIATLGALIPRLEDYKEKEKTKWLAKGKEEKAEAIEDKVDTLIILIERLQAQGHNSLNELVSFIDTLFGDSTDKSPPKVVRLSTIHRAKGLEWKRVYALGREKFLPSKYARKDWQLKQEENLEYVLITRAMDEFIDIVLPAKEA